MRSTAGMATVAALVVGLGTAATVPAAQAAEERPIVLTRGHIDLFELTYDDAAEALRLQVKDDSELYGTGTRYHAPTDVALDVDEELAEFVLTDDLPASYDFLGAAGDTVYVLPETQDPALPWPGWSTERLPESLPAGTSLPSSGSPVELALDVEGPGEIYSWMNDVFGEPINRYVDTSDEVADVIPVASRAHVHTAWAFTEPGDYTLTVTPTATTSGGDTLTGPSQDYLVRIGEGAAAPPPVAPAKISSRTAVKLMPKRVAVGKRARVAVSVTASRSGTTARGRFVVRDGRRTVARGALNPRGRAVTRLPKLRAGKHRISVRYLGSSRLRASQSKTAVLRVVKRRR